MLGQRMRRPTLPPSPHKASRRMIAWSARSFGATVPGGETSGNTRLARRKGGCQRMTSASTTPELHPRDGSMNSITALKMPNSPIPASCSPRTRSDADQRSPEPQSSQPARRMPTALDCPLRNQLSLRHASVDARRSLPGVWAKRFAAASPNPRISGRLRQ